MSTYGRIVNGSVTDVCFGPDARTAVDSSFAADHVTEFGGLQAWVVIPDGTAEDATTSDNVNFTPPSAVAQIAPAVDPIASLTASVASLAAMVQTMQASISTLQTAVVAAVPAAAEAVSAQRSQVSQPS